ncbi:hypothetical protein RRG08_015186 [Elysia crispata]|uniref:Uncharacterized protein n=1 Tax=Elysia crispata TaxID=231223 RepID=A0AAE1E6L2_9GAST|nr:hypothetical protein RRG08_015186 [Elysia crispata]
MRVFNTFRTIRSPSHASIQYLQDNSQSKSCEYSIPSGQFAVQVMRVFNTCRTIRSPSHASIQYLQDNSQSKSCEYSIPSGQYAVQVDTMISSSH